MNDKHMAEHVFASESLDPDDYVPTPVVLAHTLTLEFGRFLSQREWRTIADQAGKLPYVVFMTANAVPGLPFCTRCAHSMKDHHRVNDYDGKFFDSYCTVCKPGDACD